MIIKRTGDWIGDNIRRNGVLTTTLVGREEDAYKITSLEQESLKTRKRT